MAVLAQVPGLNVEIVDCHQQSLNEYEDDDNENPPVAEKDQQIYQLTRFIESKSGAKFGIKLSFGETFGTEYGILMHIRIDGRTARSVIVSSDKQRVNDGQYVCSYKHEYRNSRRYRRDFHFADVEVGEMSGDDTPFNLRGNAGAIGTISVILFEIKNMHQGPITSPIRNSPRHRRIQRMAEKSMKGDTRSHSFTLGERREVRAKLSIPSYDYVDGERLPFAKYHFKYRSLAALKSLYVVPRPPSPVPLEMRPEDNMGPDELTELVPRFRNRRTSTVAFKREEGHDSTRPSTDRRAGHSCVGRSIDEAIDLTGED